MSSALEKVFAKWKQEHGRYPTPMEQQTIMEDILKGEGVYKRADGRYHREDIVAAIRKHRAKKINKNLG